MLTHFRAVGGTLIILSPRPKKKIANKSYCLFLQRLLIRHKSAYTLAQTFTHQQIRAHRVEKQAWLTFTFTQFPSGFILRPSFFLFHSFLSAPLQPSDFPIPVLVDGGVSWMVVTPPNIGKQLVAHQDKRIYFFGSWQSCRCLCSFPVFPKARGKDSNIFRWCHSHQLFQQKTLLKIKDSSPQSL